MNEPQTMREYLNRPVTADEAETEGRWDRIMIKQNDPILDAHIIPGAKCVVSEATLLTAGHAYEDAAKAALDTSNYEVGLIAGARACLEAAGIEFADEVVTLRVPGGRKVDANGDLPIRLGSGDILYIKRGD